MNESQRKGFWARLKGRWQKHKDESVRHKAAMPFPARIQGILPSTVRRIKDTRERMPAQEKSAYRHKVIGGHAGMLGGMSAGGLAVTLPVSKLMSKSVAGMAGGIGLQVAAVAAGGVAGKHYGEKLGWYAGGGAKVKKKTLVKRV